MTIVKELDKNQTILYIMPSKKYNSEMIKVIKGMKNKNVAYITLNKTSDSLKELFKKKKVKIENLVFVDAISKTIKKTSNQGDQVYYCSSPGALTELSLIITKFLRHNFDYIIFDSLTNLLIYQKKSPVAKFLSSIINKIKETDTKAVFYALDMDEQEQLIKQAQMFVDKVVEKKR